ncbi:hypothetical protein B0H14DRAFT_3021559 [Mycena olivaceomarginata]|nr:hypothetical protein B0H14DRAFT_3021559 [Mycena olivaceomarginata]
MGQNPLMPRRRTIVCFTVVLLYISPQTFLDTLPILRRSPTRSNGSATGSCKDTHPPRFSSLYARPARSSTTPINGSPAAASSPPQPQPPHPQSWKRALRRTRTVSLSSRPRSRAPCRPHRPHLLPHYPHPLQLRPPPAVKSSSSSARLRSLLGGCPPTGWCRWRSRCSRTSARRRCTSCAGGRSCFCPCWLGWAWRGGSAKYKAADAPPAEVLFEDEDLETPAEKEFSEKA